MTHPTSPIYMKRVPSVINPPPPPITKKKRNLIHTHTHHNVSSSPRPLLYHWSMMAFSHVSCKKSLNVPTMAVAEAASCCFAVLLVCFILMSSDRGMVTGSSKLTTYDRTTRGSHLLDRPCDEIYVVGEGETLHTISDKCGDPFIVERIPHIHDPDDVFPGLVIKITPSRNRKLLR